MKQWLLRLLGIQSPSWLATHYRRTTVLASILWVPRDFWIGVYVADPKRITFPVRDPSGAIFHHAAIKYTIYVCLVPMVPIRIIVERAE